MAFWPYLYNQNFGAPSVGAPSFFSTISMFREFWAEDPLWTPPSPDSALTNLVRDNGAAGEDLNQVGGSVVYRADKVAGKPAWDFTADASLALRTTNGQSFGATGFTNFVVFQLDTLGVVNTLVDSGAVKNQGFMSVNSSNQYRAYTNNGSVEVSGGAANTETHLMMTVFENNNTRIYVDGVLQATDSVASIADAYGFTIGCNYAVTAGGVYGAVAYAGQYHGDMTLDAGYNNWLLGVISHYGIKLPVAEVYYDDTFVGDYNQRRPVFSPIDGKLFMSERVGSGNSNVSVYDITDPTTPVEVSNFTPTGGSDDAHVVGYDFRNHVWYCGDSIEDNWYAMELYGEPPTVVSHLYTGAESGNVRSTSTLIYDNGDTVVHVASGNIRIRDAANGYAILTSIPVGASQDVGLLKADENTLVVCEDTGTVKILDITDRSNVVTRHNGNLTATSSSIHRAVGGGYIWSQSTSPGLLAQHSLVDGSFVETHRVGISAGFVLAYNTEPSNDKIVAWRSGYDEAVLIDISDPTNPTTEKYWRMNQAIPSSTAYCDTTLGVVVISGTVNGAATGQTQPWAILTWDVTPPASNAKATGGKIYELDGYVYHEIYEDTTFTPTVPSLDVEYLVQAGGGGGGGGTHSGGGGAGEALTGSTTITTAQAITIGAGGALGTYAQGSNGEDTVFGTIATATGGGGGGGQTSDVDSNADGQDGLAGGNGGGGGGGGTAGGASLGGVGLQFNGGAGLGSNSGTTRSGGGGGGAGGAGSNGTGGTGGFGGIGIPWPTGSRRYTGGGGGGGANVGRSGGRGGGGTGGTTPWANTGITPGVPGTGGGGGGSSSNTGRNGGSGCVKIRYAVA